ncbi:MAG: tRNA guanosine(34) transglycosylase Tgt [bacterium]
MSQRGNESTVDLETPFSFQTSCHDPRSRARRGRLVTGHGIIETPVFMPVGTVGSVKAMTFESLWDCGARLILGNTYHLYLRPGHELVAQLGGLHRFQGWDGAILTDSAGFQVFSLASLNRIDNDGVEFQSHLDGSRHYFTPELSLEVQLALGADIVMAFDHCSPFGAAEDEVRDAVDRTTTWARRCREVCDGGRLYRDGWERVLFGIVQGGVFALERVRSAAALVELDLPGYAIGGLSVGEPKAAMREMTELTAGLLPPERPLYLMGVGFPDDIVESVQRGVDMFDCVLPTRMARTGTVLTRDGRLVVKNSSYARDESPLAADCRCPVCRRHSRAYLRHLFNSREILASILATTHNLYFYQELMADIRDALGAGTFDALAREVVSRWQTGEAERLSRIADEQR